MFDDNQKAALQIAFFLHDLRGGGVERISVHLANAMRRMGHAVTLVLVNKCGNPAYFDAINPEIPVVELPQKRTLTSAFGFRQYIQRHKPDLIISALTHINVSTLLSVKFMKSKPHIFVIEHNHQIERQLNGKVENLGLAVRLAFRLVPYLYPDADTVGAVSDGIRKSLSTAIKIPRERINVLNNPVKIPKADELSNRSTVPTQLSAQQIPFILGVGALSFEKNFSLLIEAFKRVRRKRPLKLIIAGEGPKRPELERQARDTGYENDIHLPGFVDDPYALMREAKLLALTSKWEGLPTVLIEAMALGRSVVATDCPSGPSEILMGGSLGCLVPPNDAEALAHSIERTLDAPQNPTELMRRAADFAPEATAGRYLDVYYAAQEQKRGRYPTLSSSQQNDLHRVTH